MNQDITIKEQQRREAISKAMRHKFDNMTPEERRQRRERIAAKAALKNALLAAFKDNRIKIKK